MLIGKQLQLRIQTTKELNLGLKATEKLVLKEIEKAKENISTEFLRHIEVI